MSGACLEKLIVSELVRIFSTFYGTRSFITLVMELRVPKVRGIS